MSKYLAAMRTVETLRSALIHLEEAVASAARALQPAQELHRKTLEAFLTAQRQHLLAILEAERLRSLANAEAYPGRRDHYMAEAEKRAEAYTILSEPAGTQEEAA